MLRKRRIVQASPDRNMASLKGSAVTLPRQQPCPVFVSPQRGGLTRGEPGTPVWFGHKDFKSWWPVHLGGPSGGVNTKPYILETSWIGLPDASTDWHEIHLSKAVTRNSFLDNSQHMCELLVTRILADMDYVNTIPSLHLSFHSVPLSVPLTLLPFDGPREVLDHWPRRNVATGTPSDPLSRTSVWDKCLGDFGFCWCSWGIITALMTLMKMTPKSFQS